MLTNTATSKLSHTPADECQQLPEHLCGREKCPHCDEYGYTSGVDIVPVCCGRPLSSGTCCGNPDPGQKQVEVPCDNCHGEGYLPTELIAEPGDGAILISDAATAEKVAIMQAIKNLQTRILEAAWGEGLNEKKCSNAIDFLAHASEQIQQC